METIIVQTNFEDFVKVDYFEKNNGKISIKIDNDFYIEAFPVYDWNVYYIVRVSKLLHYRDWVYPIYKRFELSEFDKACIYLQQIIDEYCI